MDHNYEIKRLTLSDLRNDHEGFIISNIAALISEVFSEPPWSESFSSSRLMFGLGVEMMRKCSILVVAMNKKDSSVVGYILGQEIFKDQSDDRDQTLFKISGRRDLDYLFANNQRVFYVSGIGVARQYRGQGLAESLSSELIHELRRLKFNYRLGRTDINAISMRKLYVKQGFQELSVHDVTYPSRSYWLLNL